jgi:hypothetical protein
MQVRISFRGETSAKVLFTGSFFSQFLSVCSVCQRRQAYYLGQYAVHGVSQGYGQIVSTGQAIPILCQ